MIRTLSWALTAIATLTLNSGLQTPAIVEKDVTVRGHRLHYLEAGSGPAVVLLHGMGADSRAWRFVLPSLAANFHVFAIDQVGFGQSDKPDIPYRVSVLVDHVSGFLDAVKIPTASIVGHSLGGWVAARFAVAHPDRVDRLVLVDAAGYGDDPMQMVGDYLSQFDPAAVQQAEQFLSTLSPSDRRAVEAAAVAYFSRRVGRADSIAVVGLVDSLMRGEDLLGSDVKQIHAPTLVVWGRLDKTIPLKTGEAFAHDIPAPLVVLDGCGHRPQGECASEFNEAVNDFLLGRRTDRK
jgi:pimeloyl-ACP methyl ester carboxylesterase